MFLRNQLDSNKTNRIRNSTSSNVRYAISLTVSVAVSLALSNGVGCLGDFALCTNDLHLECIRVSCTKSKDGGDELHCISGCSQLLCWCVCVVRSVRTSPYNVFFTKLGAPACLSTSQLRQATVWASTSDMLGALPNKSGDPSSVESNTGDSFAETKIRFVCLRFQLRLGVKIDLDAKKPKLLNSSLYPRPPVSCGHHRQLATASFILYFSFADMMYIGESWHLVSNCRNPNIAVGAGARIVARTICQVCKFPMRTLTK